MNTAEMWLKAQEDGKTYENINGEMAYSKKYGLVEKYNFENPWGLEAWESYKQKGLDDLLSCEWEEMNAITIEEAERRLGVKIIV